MVHELSEEAGQRSKKVEDDMSECEKDEILDGIDGVLKAIEKAEGNHKFKKRR
jgi:hypothetical protein